VGKQRKETARSRHDANERVKEQANGSSWYSATQFGMTLPVPFEEFAHAASATQRHPP
jgi:hypothetical protein